MIYVTGRGSNRGDSARRGSEFGASDRRRDALVRERDSAIGGSRREQDGAG